MTARTAHDSLQFELNSMLMDWHRWQASYRLGRGFAGRDSTCRDYRAPGHWDWKNGASDARAEDLRLQAIDEAISKVPNNPRRWQTALQFEARNLATGAAVWSSPLLPTDPVEREVLVLEARNLLARQLRRAGLLE